MKVRERTKQMENRNIVRVGEASLLTRASLRLESVLVIAIVLELLHPIRTGLAAPTLWMH